MTIERKLGIFDINKVLINRYITSDHVRDVFAAINYLYEALGSEAVPNGGTEEIAGHDHAELGGAPIPRGGVGTWSGGRYPILTWVPEGGGWQFPNKDNTVLYDIDPPPTNDAVGAHRIVYVSPGIDTVSKGSYLTMVVRYHWPEDAGYRARVRFTNPDVVTAKPWLRNLFKNYVEFEAEPHSDMQEVVFRFPCREDYWNRIIITSKVIDERDSYSEEFKVYSITWHETVADSQPKTSGYMRFS